MKKERKQQNWNTALGAENRGLVSSVHNLYNSTVKTIDTRILFLKRVSYQLDSIGLWVWKGLLLYCKDASWKRRKWKIINDLTLWNHKLNY